jgi:hypothetical protein
MAAFMILYLLINQPDAIRFAGITFTNISCYNGNDGTVTISATGAIATLCLRA